MKKMKRKDKGEKDVKIESKQMTSVIIHLQTPKTPQDQS